MSNEIVDDKSEHCVPFILERIKLHGDSYKSRGETPPPFFIGLNGVQGAGKTTLVGLYPFRTRGRVFLFFLWPLS